MSLKQEARAQTAVDYKLTEDFLHRSNLKVTKQVEKAPTLIWAIELIDYLLHHKRPEAPIVLTRSVDKERETLSIQVNRGFSELTTRQQILSVYYLGQLSAEQGFSASVTLDGSLHPQIRHTVIDVLQYSRQGDSRQLFQDISDVNGWWYVRLPQG